MRASLAIFGCGLALALPAVGCGGSGSGGSSSTTSTTSTATSAAGGEASIENFGSEAGGSEQAAILAAFHGYLDAVAAHDSNAACSHLSATVQRSLEQFVPGRLKSKGCAALLPRLLSAGAAPIARDQATGRVTRVRVGGNRGFVVYHAPGATLYQMTMVRQNGAWKTATIAGSILVPSPVMLGEGR